MELPDSPKDTFIEFGNLLLSAPLDLLAVNAGVADLWEVQLFPGPTSTASPSRWRCPPATAARQRNKPFLATPATWRERRGASIGGRFRLPLRLRRGLKGHWEYSPGSSDAVAQTQGYDQQSLVVRP